MGLIALIISIIALLVNFYVFKKIGAAKYYWAKLREWWPKFKRWYLVWREER